MVAKKLKELNSFNNLLESKEAHKVIDSLQEELVAVKLREAENNDEMKSLKERIIELEEMNTRLKEIPPDHAVAQLQEELIAVKLREAEFNLSMKELRQNLSDLQQMWSEHLSTSHPSSDSSQPNSLENSSLSNQSTLSVTSSPLKMLGNSLKRNNDYCNEINRLKQDLMSSRLKETEAVAELKELRQKVIDLETQNQVSLNQIRRQAEEMNKLKQDQENFFEKEKNFMSEIQKERRKYMDLDSRFKEQQMMNRIKDLEQTQIIAELKQKVSFFEIKVIIFLICLLFFDNNFLNYNLQTEEMMTVKKVMESGNEPESAEELQDKMAELQTEMFRLKIQQQNLNAMNSTNKSVYQCKENSYSSDTRGSDLKIS